MKEELQGKMIEILTSIQNTVGQAKDFAVEQLPDIAQQYVVFGMVSNITMSVIVLLLSIGFAVLAYKLYKYPDNKGSYGGIGIEFGFGIFSSIIGSLGCMLAFILTLKETLLVVFAPKVWLLMELAKLVK